MSVIPNRCSQTRHFSMELRPRLLKDCLLEDPNSCSSSGFRSFPRQPQKPNLVKTPQAESKPATAKTKDLSKKRSKTLQAVINAVVKRFHLATVKAPAILPRSISRRLTSKKDSLFFFSRREKVTEANKIIIRVKDIVRWRSSRDLNEEKSWPLDTELSPPRQQTTTTTTTSNSTPRSSNCSSWNDSDFTSEFLPSWGINSEENGENESGGSKKFLPSVGGDCMETPTAVEGDKEVGHEDLPCNGKNKYYSPLCVLDVQSENEEDDEESISSFSQSLAKMERSKQRLMQKIKRFESLAKIEPLNLNDEWTREEEYSRIEREEESEDEEIGEDGVEIENKENQLWNQVKASCNIWSDEEQSWYEPVILDFFRDELARSHHETYRYQKFENELVARANAWMSDVKGSGIEWGSLEQKREDCVRDMERAAGKWEGFSEEQEEVAMEIENGLLGILLDEMSDDAYLKSSRSSLMRWR